MESTDTLKRSAEDTLESVEKNKLKIDEIKEPSGACGANAMGSPILIGFIDEEGEIDYIFHQTGDVNETTEKCLKKLYITFGEEHKSITNAFFDVLACQLTVDDQKEFDTKGKKWTEYVESSAYLSYDDLKELNNDKRWITLTYGKLCTSLNYGKLAVRSYMVNLSSFS